MFNKIVRFYSEELLAPRPTHNLGDYPLSAVRDCLFHIFAAILYIGGRSSIRNLRTCHAVVTCRTFIVNRVNILLTVHRDISVQ